LPGVQSSRLSSVALHRKEDADADADAEEEDKLRSYMGQSALSTAWRAQMWSATSSEAPVAVRRWAMVLSPRGRMYGSAYASSGLSGRSLTSVSIFAAAGWRAARGGRLASGGGLVDGCNGAMDGVRTEF
jgi:hypothetical protein